jgi:hypothetical protein
VGIHFHDVVVISGLGFDPVSAAAIPLFLPVLLDDRVTDVKEETDVVYVKFRAGALQSSTNYTLTY